MASAELSGQPLKALIAALAAKGYAGATANQTVTALSQGNSIRQSEILAAAFPDFLGRR